MFPLITQALPLNAAFGTIGSGIQDPTAAGVPTAQTAMSRAEQRVHDLAGGATGEFNVSLGGSNANYVYIGVIMFAMFMIMRFKK